MLFLQPVVVNDASAADRPTAAEVRIVERTHEAPQWTGLMLAQGPTDQRSPFGAGAPDKNDVTPPPNFVPPNPPSNDPTPDETGKGPFTDPSSKKVPPPPVRPDAGPPPPTGKFTNHTDMVGPLAQNSFLGGTAAPGTNPNANIPGTGANIPGIQNTPGGGTVPGATPTTNNPGTVAPGGTTLPGATPLSSPSVTGTGGTSGSATTPGLGGASGTLTTPGTSGITPGTSGITPGTTTVPGGSSTTTPGTPSAPAFPPSSTTFPGASSGASNTR